MTKLFIVAKCNPKFTLNYSVLGVSRASIIMISSVEKAVESNWISIIFYFTIIFSSGKVKGLISEFGNK